MKWGCVQGPIAFVGKVFIKLLISFRQGLNENFMNVKVFPLLWWSLEGSLKTTGPLFCLNRFERYQFTWIQIIGHVTFCQDKHNVFAWFDFLNLIAPFIDSIKTWFLVDSYADHEYVCSFILYLSVLNEVHISRCIMDLNIKLLVVYVFSSFVNILKSRFIILGESIADEVFDQARLSYCQIANYN